MQFKTVLHLPNAFRNNRVHPVTARVDYVRRRSSDLSSYTCNICQYSEQLASVNLYGKDMLMKRILVFFVVGLGAVTGATLAARAQAPAPAAAPAPPAHRARAAEAAAGRG